MIRHLIISLFACTHAVTNLQANAEPEVVINSAAMRDGTTYLDVSFRVNDSDDATVKTRALAFVDGVRSFANILRPETFIEGTSANLGDSIPTSTDLTLTWDVGADWDVELGQIKFEVLAQDDRGLLPFDWITIPATADTEELSISLNSPTDEEVLDALFWQYASGDTGLSLVDGILTGNTNSGIFSGIILTEGVSLRAYAAPYVFKQMNLDAASSVELSFAEYARAGVSSPEDWHACNRPWAGIAPVIGWGTEEYGEITQMPKGCKDVVAVEAGYRTTFLLLGNGTVRGFGWSYDRKLAIPDGLTDVVKIATSGYHTLALKSDGTVVAWGNNTYGEATIPEGLDNVIDIDCNNDVSMAVKSDGKIVAWGRNFYNLLNIPTEAVDIKEVSLGTNHCVALKNDKTVVAWGHNYSGQATPPANLTDVKQVAAQTISLALREDGSLVPWGTSIYGLEDIPTDLPAINQISTDGGSAVYALTPSGDLYAWGDNFYGILDIPEGIAPVKQVSGVAHTMALLEQGM